MTLYGPTIASLIIGLSLYGLLAHNRNYTMYTLTHTPTTYQAFFHYTYQLPRPTLDENDAFNLTDRIYPNLANNCIEWDEHTNTTLYEFPITITAHTDEEAETLAREALHDNHPTIAHKATLNTLLNEIGEELPI